jgi:DNA-binding IclR family transcriptional regulator
MGALGFAINDARGQALAAISLSAVLDRLKDDRVKMIADKLRTAIQEIEQRVALISQGEFGHR